MNRRIFNRTALLTLGLATLAACVVNLSFDMKKQLAVQANATSGFSQTVTVTLSDYKEITDHKDNIKSFDLDSVDVTVSAVNPANTAKHVSGTLVLRSNPTDATTEVPVGAVSQLPITVGQTVNIKGTPQLDAFLLQQLQGAKTFYAVITNGSVDGNADLVLDMNMHVSIGYDAGIL